MPASGSIGDLPICTLLSILTGCGCVGIDVSADPLNLALALANNEIITWVSFFLKTITLSTIASTAKPIQIVNFECVAALMTEITDGVGRLLVRAIWPGLELDPDELVLELAAGDAVLLLSVPAEVPVLAGFCPPAVEPGVEVAAGGAAGAAGTAPVIRLVPLHGPPLGQICICKSCTCDHGKLVNWLKGVTPANKLLAVGVADEPKGCPV